MLSAADVLAAIRWCHPQAALVHEVVLRTGDGIDRRIDALMFRTQVRTAIEVKVTRADFRRDTAAKRDPWRAITHRFVYAAPAGVIDPDEVPDGCGLWVVDPIANWYAPGQTRVVKLARRNPAPAPLPPQVVQVLAYRATPPLFPDAGRG